VSVNPVFPVVFNGGQMTDLPIFSGSFDGTELFEVVAPGNEVTGVNYSITSLLLSALMAGFNQTPIILTSGATVGAPYVAAPTSTRILLNKTVGAPSGVNIGGGAARNNLPIMVRDIKGDGDTNNISVFFTGTCDGLASPIVIASAFAGFIFNPLPNGNWYLSTA
jgi:hypothetical protein